MLLLPAILVDVSHFSAVCAQYQSPANSIVITSFSMLAIYASPCFTFAQMGSWIRYVRTVLLEGAVLGTFPALIPANGGFLLFNPLGEPLSHDIAVMPGSTLR